jgi:hypothetical protein
VPHTRSLCFPSSSSWIWTWSEKKKIGKKIKNKSGRASTVRPRGVEPGPAAWLCHYSIQKSSGAPYTRSLYFPWLAAGYELEFCLHKSGTTNLNTVQTRTTSQINIAQSTYSRAILALNHDSTFRHRLEDQLSKAKGGVKRKKKRILHVVQVRPRGIEPRLTT